MVNRDWYRWIRSVDWMLVEQCLVSSGGRIMYWVVNKQKKSQLDVQQQPT